MDVFVVMAAACLALALGPGARPTPRPTPRPNRDDAEDPAWVRRPSATIAGCGVVAATWAWGPPGIAVPLAVALMAAGHLHRRRRAREELDVRRNAVGQICRALAADLTAGRTPESSLSGLIPEHPELAPVRAALDLGMDPSEAWRRVGQTPGAGGLVMVGAAWQFSHRTGAPVADTVVGVSDHVLASTQAMLAVESELSSARATSRLLAWLPVLALGLGAAMGHSAIGFFGTRFGVVCAVAGIALQFCGLLAIELMTAKIARGADSTDSLSDLMVLITAGLRAGLPPEQAVVRAAEALPGAASSVVLGETDNGMVTTDLLWSRLAATDECGPLGGAVRRAQESGASAAHELSRLADQLAHAARDRHLMQARTIGVRAAVPLGLLMLPGFLLLAVVPFVATLFADVLSTTR